MSDETWRSEIRETALLLEAVASGDRSRVVKQLTDYLLAKKEEEQTASKATQEEGGYYEGDQAYGQEGDGYAYDHDGYGHEPYDEYGSEEYAQGDEGYEEPYMSGAYNEHDATNDAYDPQAYEADYSYDNNYDPASDGTQMYGTRQHPQNYQNPNMQANGYGYEDNSGYDPQQQYTQDYMQGENGYGDGSYPEDYKPNQNIYGHELYTHPDASSQAYQNQVEAPNYGAFYREWPKESGYGSAFPDEMQVDDVVPHPETEQAIPEEEPMYEGNDAYEAENPSNNLTHTEEEPMYQENEAYEAEDPSRDPTSTKTYLRDDESELYPSEDPTHAEAQLPPDEGELYHEIQIFPDPGQDPYPDEAHEEPGQHDSEIQHVFPRQDNVERDLTPSTVRENPPTYSEVQKAQNMQDSAVQRAPSAAIPRRFRSLARPQTAYQGQQGPFSSASGEMGSASDEPEDTLWEDDAVSEDGVLSPTSPRTSDLQYNPYNPYSQQDSGHRLVMPMPSRFASSRRVRMRASWEQ